MNPYQTIDDGRLVYSIIPNDELLVGTNLTNFGNGAVDLQNISGTVTIPDTFNGMPISQVGQYAFTQCYSLKHIIIGKNVVIIHTYAFGDLPNVETVFIPSSVQILYANAIMFYNESSHGYGQGSSLIYFERNSQITFVNSSFTCQKKVAIFTPSKISPICGETGILKYVEEFHLFSPVAFRFCDIWFPGQMTCKNSLSISFFILIIIVSLSTH